MTREKIKSAKPNRPGIRRAMRYWRAPEAQQKSNVWPPTPDPSPYPSPEIAHWDSDADTVMSMEERVPSEPKSLASSHEGRYSPPQPLLADVLANTASPPYTLSAFTAFLSQNHCLETLEYTLAARRYQKQYDRTASYMAGHPMTSDSPEVRELQNHWRKLIDVFLSPGSFREINLPAEERDELLHAPYQVRPPPPEMLEPSIKRMHDLMQESIFLPFLHHHSASMPPMPIYHTISPNPNLGLFPDPPMDDYADNSMSHKPSKRKHSAGTHADARTRNSPPPGSHRLHGSMLTSALHRPVPVRTMLQPSHTSAASSSRDCAVTDDSGSASPGSEAMTMTPPTTPPTSDTRLDTSHSPKSRNDNGAWKKMGAKLGWSRRRSDRAASDE